MIKRVIYAIMAVAATVAVGCADKKIIPDETLSDIFHDAFVVNAYIGEERINIDSLHIYEPIFKLIFISIIKMDKYSGNIDFNYATKTETQVEK